MNDEILNQNAMESEDEESYLQKVDLKKLSEETGLDYQGICNLVGIKEVKNLYKWTGMKMKGNGRPKYNAIVRLLEKGASVESLFGVKYKAGNSEAKEFKGVNSAEVLDIARQMLIDSMSQTLEKLKSDGPKPPQK